MKSKRIKIIAFIFAFAITIAIICIAEKIGVF
jgi:hypothetical protein